MRAAFSIAFEKNLCGGTVRPPRAKQYYGLRLLARAARMNDDLVSR